MRESHAKLTDIQESHAKRVRVLYVRVFFNSRNVQNSVTQIIYLGQLPRCNWKWYSRSSSQPRSMVQHIRLFRELGRWQGLPARAGRVPEPEPFPRGQVEGQQQLQLQVDQLLCGRAHYSDIAALLRHNTVRPVTPGVDLPAANYAPGGAGFPDRTPAL